MNLPVYKEVKTKVFDINSLYAVLKRHEVGKVPCYLELPKDSPDGLKKIIVNLLLAFKKLEVNPRFPYPFYLISKINLGHQMLPIINDVKKLPRFFRCRVKKTNNRENNIISKIAINREKIYNLDLNQLFHETRKIGANNKTLFELAKTSYYYEQILQSYD